MNIIAIKKFRNKHNKGDVIQRGEKRDLDEGYAQDLIQTGLAVKDTKALADYHDKMLQDYANKGLAVHTETPDQRERGMFGPTRASETAEQRERGYHNAKAEAQTAKPSDSPTLGPKGKPQLWDFTDTQAKKPEPPPGAGQPGPDDPDAVAKIKAAQEAARPNQPAGDIVTKPKK